MASFVAKFISEKLPVVDAVKEVFPIWRFLVRYPYLFFTEIANSNRLSMKNALSFCFGSATVIAAALVSLYSALSLFVGYLYPQEKISEIGLTRWFLIEVAILVMLVAGAFVSAVFNYLSALCVLKIVSFKRLLIASFYMNTFLSTINIALVLMGVCIVLTTGSFKPASAIVQVGQTQIPFGDPEIKTGNVFDVWSAIYKVWTFVGVPTLFTTANVYVTGIGAKRWVVGTNILAVVGIGLAVAVSYLIHRLS